MCVWFCYGYRCRSGRDVELVGAQRNKALTLVCFLSAETLKQLDSGLLSRRDPFHMAASLAHHTCVSEESEAIDYRAS